MQNSIKYIYSKCSQIPTHNLILTIHSSSHLTTHHPSHDPHTLNLSDEAANTRPSSQGPQAGPIFVGEKQRTREAKGPKQITRTGPDQRNATIRIVLTLQCVYLYPQDRQALAGTHRTTLKTEYIVGGSYRQQSTSGLSPKRTKLTYFTHIYFYY